MTIESTKLVPSNRDAPPEVADLLETVRGSWAILRKGQRIRPPRARPFKTETKARAAWQRLDVREGWAALVDEAGTTIARQSGPWGVRGRGRW